VWGNRLIQFSVWQHLVLHKWSREKEGTYRELQKKASAQGVRVFRFFLGLVVFRWGYVFPLGLWFLFWFMVFVWVYVCVILLVLCYSYVLSFGFMLLLSSFRFGYMIFLCSFGFGYKVIWDGRGEVCLAQRAREELWLENLFLTTTGTQLRRGLSYGGCTAIQG